MNKEHCKSCSLYHCTQISSSKKQVRIYLAMYGASMFLAGMATFMFVLCSKSPEHLRDLGHMFGVESNKSEQITGKLK